MHWWVNIEKKINISVGNVSVGSEYMPILQYKCISKVQSKLADTVDEHHAPGVIYGCAVAGIDGIYSFSVTTK